VTGGDVNERSDLYAMGVMMFEVFTGTLPYRGGSAIEICMAHVKQPTPSPSERWDAIPRALETIILACMDKNPDRRPASADELLNLLLQVRRQSAAATMVTQR
jgi:serine/threonine-protein kinase